MFLALAIVVVLLALVGCSWWLGTLSRPQEPVQRPLAPPRRQQVVVLDEGTDGVFRAVRR